MGECQQGASDDRVLLQVLQRCRRDAFLPCAEMTVESLGKKSFPLSFQFSTRKILVAAPADEIKHGAQGELYFNVEGITHEA